MSPLPGPEVLKQRGSGHPAAHSAWHTAGTYRTEAADRRSGAVGQGRRHTVLRLPELGLSAPPPPSQKAQGRDSPSVGRECLHHCRERMGGQGAQGTQTKVKVKVLVAQSCLFGTPRTVASQAPLSTEFSWGPSNPGIKPRSPTLQADA